MNYYEFTTLSLEKYTKNYLLKSEKLITEGVNFLIN